MRKKFLATSLACILCLSLSAAYKKANSSISHSFRAPIPVTLYANFTAKNGEVFFKESLLEQVTAFSLAEELSKWSGLRFSLQSVRATKNSITIDWATDASLFSSLPQIAQKEHFTFHSLDALRWFMLDSLAHTLRKNLSIEEVYYTMHGGQELMLPQLQPQNTFPLLEPYVHSPYYTAKAFMEKNKDNAKLLQQTKGIWRKNGVHNSPYIVMDGKGAFIKYTSHGQIEYKGFLTYANDNMAFDSMYRYYVYCCKDAYSSSYRHSFDFKDAVSLVYFENTTAEPYVKDGTPATKPVIAPMGGGIETKNLTPIAINNRYQGGYYYAHLSADARTEIIHAGFHPTQATTSMTKSDAHIVQMVQELMVESMQEVKLWRDMENSARLNYPVFGLSWASGTEEDRKYAEAFFLDTGGPCYVYAFRTKGQVSAQEHQKQRQVFSALAWP